jgi:UDP-N-acetylmuramyl pentapeptide phosphotransferase/UDP-N-acetylglucosamine-1-phosphate transferase
MLIYFQYLFIIIALFAGMICYFKLADRFNIIDKPNQRSSHNYITIRGGGIVFWLAGALYAALHFTESIYFFAGLTLICGVSLWDDIVSLPNSIRIVAHFASISLIFYGLSVFVLPWWLIVTACILFIGILNAYNFMDGINGITGGYSFVILLVLIYINHAMVSFVEQNLIYTMLFAVIVFNFFNFRKRAKCFAGDIGSVSIAFTLLFLIGRLIIETEDLSWIILLVVYGVDSMLTIVHRLMLKENITLPHRKHLYQIMANELKIPHIVVSSIYMLIQGTIMVGYLMLQAYSYWYLLGTIILLSGVYVYFMKKYFSFHLPNQATNINTVVKS